MGKSILYIVGFMGAGKTSVGSRLAERLVWRFVDLDREIEERAGTSIRELFRREGEPSFRLLETSELRRVSTGSQVVVALGGGAFCSRENQDIIRSTGASIWLDVPLEVLFTRCEDDGSRPLFTGREEMRALFERRRPFYEKADLHVPAAGMDVDQVAGRILQLLAEK
jgi:shikimate kinase